MKKLFEKIYLKIENFFLRKRDKRLSDNFKNELIHVFEKNHKVNHKEVVQIMKKTPIFINGEERIKYLEGKLLEGQKLVNSKNNKSPYFYNPEIIEIHNDNLIKTNPSIEKIKKIDFEISDLFLKKQHIKNYKNNTFNN